MQIAKYPYSNIRNWNKMSPRLSLPFVLTLTPVTLKAETTPTQYLSRWLWGMRTKAAVTTREGVPKKQSPTTETLSYKWKSAMGRNANHQSLAWKITAGCGCGLTSHRLLSRCHRSSQNNTLQSLQPRRVPRSFLVPQKQRWRRVGSQGPSVGVSIHSNNSCSWSRPGGDGVNALSAK